MTRAKRSCLYAVGIGMSQHMRRVITTVIARMVPIRFIYYLCVSTCPMQIALWDF